SLAQRYRDSRSRHVAVPLDVDVHAFHRNLGTLGDGFDDSKVSLVWDDEIHVVGLQIDLRERAFAGSSHAVHSSLEDLLALELPPHGAVKNSTVRISSAHPVHA